MMGYKLFFWQNIVSHLQLPYIREIAKQNIDYEIFLIVPEVLGKERKNLGWNEEVETELKNLSIVVEEDLANLSSYFKSDKNHHHFFSGIRATPLVLSALKESLKHDVKRHLIVEGPFYYSHSKSLHLLKTFFFERQYFKHIDKVFAIGHHATDWYRLWGFRDHQIIPFSYCVDLGCNVIDSFKNEHERLKCIYIGSLSHRKGVDLLLQSMSKLDLRSIDLTIVGDGGQKENLLNIVDEHKIENVTFTGAMNHNEVGHMLVKHDCLILPSRHDGWGAVTNEALMCGLHVICSENCGAKVLIQEGKNGFVFSHREKNDLVNALKKASESKVHIRNSKPIVRRWSSCINGQSLSRYFMENLTGNINTEPPWRLPCE